MNVLTAFLSSDEEKKSPLSFISFSRMAKTLTKRCSGFFVIASFKSKSSKEPKSSSLVEADFEIDDRLNSSQLLGIFKALI